LLKEKYCLAKIDDASIQPELIADGITFDEERYKPLEILFDEKLTGKFLMLVPFSPKFTFLVG
jgi:hypothetical protein